MTLTLPPPETGEGKNWKNNVLTSPRWGTTERKCGRQTTAWMHEATQGAVAGVDEVG